MPIRMTNDPVDPNQQNDDGGGSLVNKAMRIRSARFNNTNDGTIYFKVDVNDNKAVACIVVIDKQ